MKKLLVVLLVLAMAMFAFADELEREAEITKTLNEPVATISVSGTMEFGLLFNEHGLELFTENETNHVITGGLFSWSFAVNAQDRDDDYWAEIELNFAAPGFQAAPGAPLTFQSATYNDAMMKFGFYNTSYKTNFSTNFLANWDSTGDGVVDVDLGTAYTVTNFKALDLDLIYITLRDDAPLEKDAAANPDNTGFLFADVFAVDYGLDIGDMGDITLKSALWAAGTHLDPTEDTRTITVPATSADTTGEHLGLAAQVNFDGADILDGFNAWAMFGMQTTDPDETLDESAFGLWVNYRNGFDVVEDMVTVTPHANFTFRDGIAANMPFARAGHTPDASTISGGVDVSLTLPAETTVGIYDTFTFDLGVEDDALTSKYGVTIANTLVDLANVSAQVEKISGTDFATPIALTAKVKGSMTEDMFEMSYFVEFKGLGGALIPVTELDKIMEQFFAYEFKASVMPIDPMELSARVWNWEKDATTGHYTAIQKPADLKYNVDLSYAMNDFWTLGANVHNKDWGEYADIGWFLFSGWKFSF